MKKLFLMFLILFVLPTIVSAGMGVRFGLAKDSKDDTYKQNMTLIGVDYRFSAFPMVDIIGTVEYSSKKYNILGLEGKRHFLTINASVVKPFCFSIVKPYAGIGYGYHATGGTTQADVAAGGTRSGTGFHIIGGVKVAPPAFPLAIYGEFRKYWADIKDETRQYYTLSVGAMLGF